MHVHTQYFMHQAHLSVHEHAQVGLFTIYIYIYIYIYALLRASVYVQNTQYTHKHA